MTTSEKIIMLGIFFFFNVAFFMGIYLQYLKSKQPVRWGGGAESGDGFGWRPQSVGSGVAHITGGAGAGSGGMAYTLKSKVKNEDGTYTFVYKDIHKVEIDGETYEATIR